MPAGAVERLLWYLSATGTGSLSRFRAACAALGLRDAGQVRRVARHLRLLGHLELAAGGHWYVTPPVVIESVEPGGQTSCFLAGARDASAAALGTRGPCPGGPDRVTVSGPTPWPRVNQPGRVLAAALPDAATHAEGLEVLDDVVPGDPRCRRFDGRDFVEAVFEGGPGLYEVRAAGCPPRPAFYKGGRWHTGELVTLRFHAQLGAGLARAWRYDEDRWRLAVALGQRLPEVYERALVLCSGTLPEYRGSWLVYPGVPTDVAGLLSVRLGVALEVRGSPW